MTTTDVTETEETGAEMVLAPMRDPYAGISIAPWSSEQRAILGRALRDEEIEVRPDDGVLYLPGVRCRQRLNEAFGIGGWGLAHHGNPQVNGTQVFAPMRLYILGRFAAEACGEGKWISNNPKSTFGTALESAKTDALGRCCKDMGIALDLWDPKFTREWRTKNTVKVKNPDPARFGRAAEVWLRKDDPAIAKDSPRDPTNPDDGGPVGSGSAVAKTAAKIAATGGEVSTDQALEIGRLKGEVGGLTDDLYRKSIAVYRKSDGARCATVSDMSKDQADHYIERLKGKIAQQARRVDPGADTTGGDLGAALDRSDERIDATDALDEAGTAPLPHAKKAAVTPLRPRVLADELQRVFDKDGDESAWIHGLFGVAHAKELDAGQSETALQLLVVYGTPEYDDATAEAQKAGKIR